MNILFLGPQGSGKGTQAHKLAQELGYTYIEAGKLLREEAKINPELNEIVNNKGTMAPNHITLGLIKKAIEKQSPNAQNLIFDGYPRSTEQLNDLSNYLKEKGVSIDKVFFLSISEEETVKRLSSRRTCESCGKVFNLITNPPKGENCSCGGKLQQRIDDKPDAIKPRLKIYWENTAPLVDEFKKQGILVEIDGEQPIDEIFEKILQEVK